MKQIILGAILMLTATGCSHGKLMRCENSPPGDVFHCPDKIQGYYRICEKPYEDFQCEDLE